MIIGCTFPLLLIFLAPALGLGSGATLFFFILAMFACHLFMPMHHHDKHNSQNQPSSFSNTDSHEHKI